MSSTNQHNNDLQNLDKAVHSLNYLDSRKANKVNVKPDVERGRALAEKIRENIQSYQNEVGSSQRSSTQAL